MQLRRYVLTAAVAAGTLGLGLGAGMAVAGAATTPSTTQPSTTQPNNSAPGTPGDNCPHHGTSGGTGNAATPSFGV